MIKASFIHQGGRSASCTSGAGLKILNCRRFPSSGQKANTVSTGGHPGMVQANSVTMIIASPESLKRSEVSFFKRITAAWLAFRKNGVTGTAAVNDYSQGIKDAWITSFTPALPTERIARSTSFSPKRCVVIWSRLNRREANCCKASSHER